MYRIIFILMVIASGALFAPRDNKQREADQKEFDKQKAEQNIEDPPCPCRPGGCCPEQ